MKWSLFRRKQESIEPKGSTTPSFLQEAQIRPHWVPVLSRVGSESDPVNLVPLISNAFEKDCNAEIDGIKDRLTPQGQEWLELNRRDMRDMLVGACWDFVKRQNPSIQEYPKIARSKAKIIWEAMESCP
jgi:hypothetical protein